MLSGMTNCDREGQAYGDKSSATLQREHIVKLMAARAERPDLANRLRKVLRAIMTHAVEIGMRNDDPTRDVKASGSRPKVSIADRTMNFAF